MPNTANNHQFGHLHLLIAESYCGGRLVPSLPIVDRPEHKKMHQRFQVAPPASLQVADLRIISTPWNICPHEWVSLWSIRKGFQAASGGEIDPIALTKEG